MHRRLVVVIFSGRVEGTKFGRDFLGGGERLGALGAEKPKRDPMGEKKNEKKYICNIEAYKCSLLDNETIRIA